MFFMLTVQRRSGAEWTDGRKRALSVGTNDDGNYNDAIKKKKIQCKEVKNTTSLLSAIMLLIERHVSAYSKAIIRSNKCSL